MMKILDQGTEQRGTGVGMLVHASGLIVTERYLMMMIRNKPHASPVAGINLPNLESADVG